MELLMLSIWFVLVLFVGWLVDVCGVIMSSTEVPRVVVDE